VSGGGEEGAVERLEGAEEVGEDMLRKSKEVVRKVVCCG
jgi:hypothetical protein